MAYEYSNNEFTEMVRVLAKSHDDAARACQEFARLFPNLPRPSRELMLQATQRLRDHGQFQYSSSEMASEEDQEEQDSGGDEEGNEEGRDGEANEEDGEEEKEEEKEEVPRPRPTKEIIETPVYLPAGRGIPLGQISSVELSLSRFSTQDQMILHQYLYGQFCQNCYVTGNIKKFKGFQWAINSTEYKAKLMETARIDPRQLRAMCEMLDLDKKGGPSELAKRLMDFLHQPRASSPEMPWASSIKTDNIDAANARGRRKARSHSPPRVTHRDEEYESDQETKANDSQEGSEESDGSTKSSVSRASDTGSEGEDVIGTEDREAEAKVLPDRHFSLPKNNKNEDKRLVRSGTGEKASSEESYKEEESSEDEEGSDEEERDEESDTPADKKAKRPPTDEEIKKYLKQILEGANLEQVTMKAVCKQVYSHYPDFDLEYKKNFIKATVKSLL